MKQISKAVISLAFLLICLPAFAGSPLSFGTPKKINDDWYFIQKDEIQAQRADFDDAQWQTVDLPHDWSVKGKLDPLLASCTGYLPGGIGWYRKHLDIPASEKGKKVYLYFEGVYNRSEVYLNGKLLGKRPNGYISFYYDATDAVKYGAENVISVRVDHSRSADSRWYTGSGIYRNVWLVYSNPVHIAPWGLFAHPTNVSEQQATVSMEVAIDNDAEKNQLVKVVATLYASDGTEISSTGKTVYTKKAQSNKINLELPVSNPALWSIEAPNLYRLETKLIGETGVILDEATITTGILRFDFDPDKGFALNGKWMKLKGVCLHHDAGVLGSAVPKTVWETRLKTLKSLGCNAIRTSHNPQSPDLYDLCDEIGLLVMDEGFDEWKHAKRKWLKGWNEGTPGFESSCDFFEEWSSRDIADMVRRDRNHPSIFTWSIGNEVDYPNDPYSHPILNGAKINQPMYGGYKPEQPDANELGDIAKRLVKAVKEWDTSRPVTAALAGVIMSNETEYPKALDITGYNYTENQYAADHAKYPDRVIFGSENVHSIESWYAAKNNDYIFGQFLWTGIDYLGESRAWPSRGFYSGLLDFGGFIKPRGYFRKALWSEEPTAYIGTYQKGNDDHVSMYAWPVWNYQSGENVRVVCYTNAAKARLLLNGKEVGETKDYDVKTGIIYWDIPFQPGTLKVEALDAQGTVVCNDSVRTAGTPKKLVAAPLTGASYHGKDVIMVEIQVVDENGIRVMSAENEIVCTLSGSAELLGLEASNNSDMSDYTDNVQNSYHGRILAYIKPTEKQGDVTATFTSKGLSPVEVTVKANAKE
jgi:beta-galactosidase/beta-glucuronidase